MPRGFRFDRWWPAALIAAAILLLWMFYKSGPAEPVFLGRRLGKWLEGHPREYHPVVRAIGTNALPYLLSELRATDSGLARFGESMLARSSIGPFWRTARHRHYHAGLAIQILDTNAAPALMDAVFSGPMGLEEGDPSFSAAASLTWLSSPAAQVYAKERLAQGLQSSDVMMCRNACLALSMWNCPDETCDVRLAELTRATNAMIRAAAVRALIMRQDITSLFLPALVERLDDEQAKIRRLAIEALGCRGSNATTALPALRVAYATELTRSSLRDDLQDGYWGSHTWSAKEIRWAIRDAIKVIDPATPLPPEQP